MCYIQYVRNLSNFIFYQETPSEEETQVISSDIGAEETRTIDGDTETQVYPNSSDEATVAIPAADSDETQVRIRKSRILSNYGYHFMVRFHNSNEFRKRSEYECHKIAFASVRRMSGRKSKTRFLLETHLPRHELVCVD